MTTHSIIRKGVRALFVSLIAAGVCALWPLAAQAKGNTPRVDHAPIVIQKTTDKASTTMAKTTKGKTKGNKEQFLQYNMQNATISSYQ